MNSYYFNLIVSVKPYRNIIVFCISSKNKSRKSICGILNKSLPSMETIMALFFGNLQLKNIWQVQDIMTISIIENITDRKSLLLFCEHNNIFFQYKL